MAAESPTYFEIDGVRPSALRTQPASPGSVDDEDGASGRPSGPSRSVLVKTTTFGDISIPPRFIINVGHGFRGRLYVRCYTSGDSDVFSMPTGFRRHLVGKTFRNNFHCDIAEIRFDGKLMIMQTFS